MFLEGADTWLAARMPPGLPPLAGTQPLSLNWAASDGLANGGPRPESHSLCSVRKTKMLLLYASLTSLPSVGILIFAHSTLVECLLWGPLWKQEQYIRKAQSQESGWGQANSWVSDREWLVTRWGT